MIYREVAAYNELLQSLLIIGRTLIENNQISKGTQCMFSDVGNYENTIRRTMNQLNLTSFYGRAFLFHVNHLNFAALIVELMIIFSYQNPSENHLDTAQFLWRCTLNIIIPLIT